MSYRYFDKKSRVQNAKSKEELDNALRDLEDEDLRQAIATWKDIPGRKFEAQAVANCQAELDRRISGQTQKDSFWPNAVSGWLPAIIIGVLVIVATILVAIYF